MAEQAVEIESAWESDLAERQRTYRFFLTILRYATAAVIVVLALMAMFLL